MNTTKVHIYINNVYRHRGSTVLVEHVQEKDMNGVVQVVFICKLSSSGCWCRPIHIA